MRTARLMLAGLTLAALAFSGAGVATAHNCPGTSHQHTASGSCKGTDHNIQCGSTGQIGPDVAGTSVHVNNPTDGPQVEACNDGNAGNFNGRLMAQRSASQEGVRVILDSDRDQPFDAGWITVQASTKAGNKSGVYCSADQGEPGPQEGDGYARSWSDPGPNGGANADAIDCVPNPPDLPFP